MNIVTTQDRLGVTNSKNISGCFEVTADLSSDMTQAVALRVQAYGAKVSDDPAQSMSQLEISCSPSMPPKVRLLINNVWTQL